MLQRGRERVIGAWDLGGAIVDPGPESRIETLLAGLSEEPRALLLTHIHLDHAGAAGALVERFPELEVYVHARGAPHLIDPSQLLASAERIYGDEMGPLWGRVRAGARSATCACSRAGRRSRSRAVSSTSSTRPAMPPITSSTSTARDGTAYVGDVAGVRIPPSDFVRAPTPPPDIDVEAWQRSIDLVAARRPARLALTHFGMVEDPQPHLAQMKQALDEQAELVHELLEQHGDTDEAVTAFVAEIERRTARRSGRPRRCSRSGRPVEQRWLGLRRYWQKRAESARGVMATETIERPRVGGPGTGGGGTGG